jgi:hypothetical protein
MKDAVEEIMEQGIEKGIALGRKTKAAEIALKLNAIGRFDRSEILRITELSEEEFDAGLEGRPLPTKL